MRKKGEFPKEETLLTEGNPGKVILRFTLPIFAGNIFQEVYAIADTAITGRCLGANALAAVGSTSMVSFLLLGFMWGITAGVAVPVAQRYGAGDRAALKKAVGTAWFLVLGILTVLTAVSLLAMEWLLHLMHTPADIFSDACRYFRIICAGMGAQVIYNLLCSFLRAIGNSRTPLYFLIEASVFNIILDYLLIAVCGMGVEGAAIATIIAQGASALMCFFYIRKHIPLLMPEIRDLIPDTPTAREQIRISVPMALQLSITAAGGMIVQTSLNGIGTEAVAAVAAATKLDYTIQQWFGAQGTAMATYNAQNIGARKKDRVRAGVHAAVLQSSLYAAGTGILLFIAGKNISYLFLTKVTVQLLKNVDIYLKCVSAFYIPLALTVLYRNSLQGMGHSFLPMLAGALELSARCVVAWFAGKLQSYVWICLAGPVAWCIASVFLLCVFVRSLHDLSGT